MYPRLDGSTSRRLFVLSPQVVSNGPYKTVGDIYNIPGATSQEKDAMKKCEAKFVLLDPKPEYVIDRINNGYVTQRVWFAVPCWLRGTARVWATRVQSLSSSRTPPPFSPPATACTAKHLMQGAMRTASHSGFVP